MLLAVLSLSFTNMTEASTVIPADQQQQIADKLDEDAEVTSNATLEHLLAEEPKAVQDEVLSINTDATNRSLQVALLIPIVAGLIGLFQFLPNDAASGNRAAGLDRGGDAGLSDSREGRAAIGG